MSVRSEQKEKRRTEILSAGLDLFIRKGFAATKISDIAKQVNMSTGLMFHYFESKKNCTMTAVDQLFDAPLHEPWMDEMRRNVKFMADSFVSLGVEADLSAIPEKMIFPLDPPFTFAGVEYRFLGLNNYASFKGYAPEGCTAMTAIFFGDTYDYWKAKKESGEYEAEKQRLADEVLKLVVQKLPMTASKAQVPDVATPPHL